MIRTTLRLIGVLAVSPIVVFGIIATPVLAQSTSPGEQLASASALFDAGKFGDAAKVLDAFLAANPKHPRAGAAALALGRCRSELQQYPKAIPAYQRAIASKDPAVTTIAELGLGDSAMHVGQWSIAATALNAALNAGLTNDQSPIAYDWLGQANFQMGQYAASNAAYKQVLAKYPSSDVAADATYGAGLSALKLGKSEEARQQLQNVVDHYSSSPDRPNALTLLGQIDLEAKQYDAAKREFTQALAITGLDKETRRAAEDGEVSVLMAQKDYSGVTSLLQTRLTSLPPTDSLRFETQLNLGRALYLQKKYAPADAAYQQAAKSPDPNIASEALYWSANAALALGNSEASVARFKQLATRFPKSEFASKAASKITSVQTSTKQNSETETLQKARLAVDAKKYAAAITTLTAFLSTNPSGSSLSEAHYLLGLAYQGAEKPAQAIPQLTASVHPTSTSAWLPDAQTQLAWLYVQAKQPAKAEASANAALALKTNPGYSPDIEQQARLALVQAALDQQKWQDALAGCQALIAQNPSPDVQATVLFTQAWVSEKQGSPAAAIPIWQHLASDFPKSQYAPDAFLHLGDAAFKDKQYEQARSNYNTIVTQYPQSADLSLAKLGLGNSLYNLSQFDAAAMAFDGLAANPKAGDLRAEALYWAGASLEKAGKKSEAITRLSHLVNEYPTNTRVANAKIRLAYLKAGS